MATGGYHFTLFCCGSTSNFMHYNQYWAYFGNGPDAAVSIAPTLIWHWMSGTNTRRVHRVRGGADGRRCKCSARMVCFLSALLTSSKQLVIVQVYDWSNNLTSESENNMATFLNLCLNICWWHLISGQWKALGRPTHKSLQILYIK